MPAVDLASLRWSQFDRYEISAGYIRPASDAQLTHYNPWLEFSAQRELSSQASTQRPYHSLLELLEEITYAPGDDGLAGDLTQESKEKLTTWCASHGLLGVLLQRTRAVTLAARWTPLSEMVPGQGSESGNDGLLVPAYACISHHNRGWLSWKSVKGGSQKLRKGDNEKREKGRPLSMEEMRKIGILPHVLLQDLGKPEWQEESLDESWASFFPSVSAEDRNFFEYPLPTTETFWRLYSEPVSTFLHSAQILKHAANNLRAIKPFADASDEHKRSVALGLNALHALVLPASPALHLRDDGTFEQIWVPASLLGAYAMMLLQDLAEQAPLYRCAVCNTLFTSKSPRARYCSPRCRNTANKRIQRIKEKSKRTAPS